MITPEQRMQQREQEQRNWQDTLDYLLYGLVPSVNNTEIIVTTDRVDITLKYFPYPYGDKAKWYQRDLALPFTKSDVTTTLQDLTNGTPDKCKQILDSLMDYNTTALNAIAHRAYQSANGKPIYCDGIPINRCTTANRLALFFDAVDWLQAHIKPATTPATPPHDTMKYRFEYKRAGVWSNNIELVYKYLDDEGVFICNDDGDPIDTLIDFAKALQDADRSQLHIKTKTAFVRALYRLRDCVVGGKDKRKEWWLTITTESERNTNSSYNKRNEFNQNFPHLKTKTIP